DGIRDYKVTGVQTCALPISPDAFHVLLAHRPGAWDTAAPRGIPLTLAGHIHGGQFYLPLIGWSPGSLITKYVMGHFRRGTSQLRSEERRVGKECGCGGWRGQ